MRYLIYGASGFTGQRVAQYAVKQGHAPVLAGRNAATVRPIAEQLGLDYHQFDVNDSAGIDGALAGVDVLLNCAGPFTDTFRPLLEGCIRTKTHYLDIAGEVDVYEAVADYQQRAVDAGIVMLPGAGFDMVPGDCLAAMMAARLGDIEQLHIGYCFGGTITRGSIRSALASFSPEATVRRHQQLIKLETPLSRVFDFGPAAVAERAECVATTFGDISIAWRSCRIPNITSYLYYSEPFQKLMEVKSEQDILALPEGPDDHQLLNEKAVICATAISANGKEYNARLTTPDVYQITFPLAADIAHRLASGKASWEPGFQTAVTLFGAEYVLDFDNVELEWG